VPRTAVFLGADYLVRGLNRWLQKRYRFSCQRIKELNVVWLEKRLVSFQTPRVALCENTPNLVLKVHGRKAGTKHLFACPRAFYSSSVFVHHISDTIHPTLLIRCTHNVQHGPILCSTTSESVRPRLSDRQLDDLDEISSYRYTAVMEMDESKTEINGQMYTNRDFIV
jgi:hypothetical protein